MRRTRRVELPKPAWQLSAGTTFVGLEPGWGAEVLADRAFRGRRPEAPSTSRSTTCTLLDLVGHNLGIAVVLRPIAANKNGKLHVTALSGDLRRWRAAMAEPDSPSLAGRALLTQLGG